MAHRGSIIAVSRCSTAEEFQNAFRRYAEPTALFVPTQTPFASADTAFLYVCLSNGEILLEGDIEVRSSVDRVAGLYGRPGMTVRFVAPTAANKEMLTQLVRARTMLKPVALPDHLTARPAPASLDRERLATLTRPTAPSAITDPVLQLAECLLINEQGQAPAAFASSEYTSTKMIPVVPVEPRAAAKASTPPAAAAAESGGPWPRVGTQLVALPPMPAEAAGPSSPHVLSADNASPGIWSPDSTRTEVSPTAGWPADRDAGAADEAEVELGADEDDELEAVSTNVVARVSISKIVADARKAANAAAPAAPPRIPQTLKSANAVPMPVGPAPRGGPDSMAPEGAASASDEVELELPLPDGDDDGDGVSDGEGDGDAAADTAAAAHDDADLDGATVAFGGAMPAPPEAAAPIDALFVPPTTPDAPAVAAPSPAPTAAVSAAAPAYSGAQPLNLQEFQSARASTTMDAVMPTARAHRASLAPGGVTLSKAPPRAAALVVGRSPAKTFFLIFGLIVALGIAAIALWKLVLQDKFAPPSAPPSTSERPPRAAAPRADPPPATPEAAVAAAQPVDAAVVEPTLDAAAAPVVEPTADAATRAEPPPKASCRVALVVDPPTAIATLGDKKLGAARKLKMLPCGDLTLTLSDPKYADLTVALSLAPERKTTKKIALARPTFDIKLISKPTGAQVRIGGKLAGKTPLTYPLAGFEPHDIVLSKKGYQPKTITLVPTGTADVEYALTKK